ncbi:MAG TPA: DUF2934 domain-containing protein [Acidobacteriaceae bacterium]|nr:DUF2934 domain-containing protein [Acidobacteriaceae bacterium]
MAETTEKAKKAKAPAKPRATAGTKKTAAKKADGSVPEVNGAAAGTTQSVYVPTHEEIAVLAREYWEQRGRTHGNHVQDWLRAEQDLMKMAS